VLNAGERRRGDDPLVTEYPQHWVPDGTPIVPEVADPEVLNKARGRRRRAGVDVIAYEVLTPLDAVVLRRPLRVGHFSEPDRVTQLPAGTVLPRDSELVKQVPDAFEAPKVRR